MVDTARRLGLLTVLVGLASGCVPDADRSQRLDEAFLRVVAAEDARPTGGAALDRLVRESDHDLAFIRHAAVRALGRLEDPDLLPHIVPSLTDPSPRVRRSAANAVAQTFHDRTDGDAAAQMLIQRIPAESDAGVLATIARSLGRLDTGAPLRREIRSTLLEMTRVGNFDARQEILRGVVLAFGSLLRAHPGERLSRPEVERLEELTTYPTRTAEDPVPGQIRSLAVEALGLSGDLSMSLAMTALNDPEPRVRVTVARYLDAMEPAQQPELIRRAIADGLLQAAVEGLLLTAEHPRTEFFCRFLLAGATPPSQARRAVPPPIAVVAIDGLDRPCPDLDTQRSLLLAHADGLDDEGTPWQTATHALAALARVFPADAAERLGDHASHPNPFVRANAAGVAAVLGRSATLRSLADDPHPNVRTAAVSGLFEVQGRDADDVLVRQLTLTASDVPAGSPLAEGPDPQLALTVAGLLEGTARTTEVAGAAVLALRRLSVPGWETARDARLALLDLLGRVGDETLAHELDTYLDDFDPKVAEKAAEILSDWRGRPEMALPRPLARVELPTAEQLQEMASSTIRLHMSGGGTVDIRLMPYLAPTNAWRFHRLVREGYFDGLTFHRWAPNFVIQGGSPTANEYRGAPRHSRDEVGLPSHWRGTVGISTRGRDTGDAQIFVNLLDNVRLDHDYTIVGSVVDGMDVVDLTLEGTVIRRAEVVSAQAVAGM